MQFHFNIIYQFVMYFRTNRFPSIDSEPMMYCTSYKNKRYILTKHGNVKALPYFLYIFPKLVQEPFCDL